MKKRLLAFASVLVAVCVSFCAIPVSALTYGDFSYELVDGRAVITSYKGGAVEVTVPAEIEGYAVCEIGNSAFKGNTTLSSVTISEGIISVDDYAFENCTALAKINLPATITHIGERAIHNTAYYNDKGNWKEKKPESSGDLNIGGSGVQDTVAWEDIVATDLDYLYLGTCLIEASFGGTYKIKTGTTVIAEKALAGAEKATEVKFPTSLKSIGDYAFEGCLSLENLNIPESVSFTASSGYNTGFYNNSENWQDGVLYMGTRVVGCDSETVESHIKDGTTAIIEGALGGKNAIIPASVTTIDKNAFTDSENVTIFGYGNSYAQVYAKENSIKFVDLEALTKGDVNFDGKTDTEDYKILCNVAGLKEYKSYAITLVGDMNEDGAIDGFDALCFDLLYNDYISTTKGDVNGDKKVDENDYKMLVKIVTLSAKITDNYMRDRCDINGDGAVDSFDAMYLDLALKGYTTII